MASCYASAELVRGVMNAGRALSRAQYIYTEEEAVEQFSGPLKEISWIVQLLPKMLAINASIYFAFVASQTPYQIVHVGGGTFLVLIDQRAFYMLFGLCHRIQSLMPVSGRFGFATVECQKDYKGKFLLDIVKDLAFHTEDISPYLRADQSRLVYQAANTYIVGHEIAHASHGHLEFKASGDFAQFAVDKDDLNLTLRTLEMDADSSATSSVIGMAGGVLTRFLSSRNLSNRSPAEISRSVWEQSVVGMFIALLYMDAISENFVPAAYPISYARFLTTYDVARQTISRVDNDAAVVPEDMRLLLVSVFERLNGGVGNLGHPIATNFMTIALHSGHREYEYNALGIAAGLAHIKPLHSRWARIRPFLERYQRGGLLAPAQADPV